MSHIRAFAVGLLFASGLVLSGMTVPAKVIGFLSFTEDWDPTLAFVMMGAIGVYAPLYRLIMARRARPLFADVFRLPTNVTIDLRLILGAALFGAGWGLAGVCPGPALVALPTGAPSMVVFVVSMLAGSWLWGKWANRPARALQKHEV